MTEITISIGGREFEVACQPGEETPLRRAASVLDSQANVVVSQLGRMPADRMLLLAGLMLGDQMAQSEMAGAASVDMQKQLDELAKSAEAVSDKLETWLAAQSPVEPTEDVVETAEDNA